MSEFSFVRNMFTNKYVVSSPGRAKRPDFTTGHVPLCPFCPGREREEQEVFRIGGSLHDSHWDVRVLLNKYPFAPIHEIIIHSQDHHKNIDELPLQNTIKLFATYKERFNTHKEKGNVVIFQNHGADGGESLQHPHSQLVVTPFDINLDIVPLVPADWQTKETSHFSIFCPLTSQWPDEVWIAPFEGNKTFGEISDEEVSELALIMQKLITIFNLRHGHEFPFNYYISSWRNWYIRLIPRAKKIGGFELATNVFVNTQDPKETIAFILEHFDTPNREKILHEHKALYHRGV